MPDSHVPKEPPPTVIWTEEQLQRPWPQIRTHAEAHGLRSAAKAYGVPVSTAYKRSRRDGWKLPEEVVPAALRERNRKRRQEREEDGATGAIAQGVATEGGLATEGEQEGLAVENSSGKRPAFPSVEGSRDPSSCSLDSSSEAFKIAVAKELDALLKLSRQIRREATSPAAKLNAYRHLTAGLEKIERAGRSVHGYGGEQQPQTANRVTVHVHNAKSAQLPEAIDIAAEVIEETPLVLPGQEDEN